jgi:hypothetical protein
MLALGITDRNKHRRSSNMTQNKHKNSTKQITTTQYVQTQESVYLSNYSQTLK